MTAIVIIVGILSALLVRVAIGMAAYIASGGLKKKTPAHSDEELKIVEAKADQPASHGVSIPARSDRTREAPVQFYEEDAEAEQQVAHVARKSLSGSEIDDQRRVLSTMHSSRHPNHLLNN